MAHVMDAWDAFFDVIVCAAFVAVVVREIRDAFAGG
jgi:hypothetical protein